MFNVRCWGYRNSGQGVHEQELIIYNATMPADPARGIICNAYNNTYFQIYSLSLSLAIVFRCQTQESHLSAVVFKKLFSDSSPFIRLSLEISLSFENVNCTKKDCMKIFSFETMHDKYFFKNCTLTSRPCLFMLWWCYATTIHCFVSSQHAITCKKVFH